MSVTEERMTEAALGELEKVMKKRSPTLNLLEKAVYDRCLETGDGAETAYLNDPGVHIKVTMLMAERVDLAKIQEKLEGAVVWWKKREEMRVVCEKYEKEAIDAVDSAIDR